MQVRERIRINGKPISPELFTKHFWRLYHQLEKFKVLGAGAGPSSQSWELRKCGGPGQAHLPRADELFNYGGLCGPISPERGTVELWRARVGPSPQSRELWNYGGLGGPTWNYGGPERAHLPRVDHGTTSDLFLYAG